MDHVWLAADMLASIGADLMDTVGGVPLMVWIACAGLWVAGLIRNLADGPPDADARAGR